MYTVFVISIYFEVFCQQLLTSCFKILFKAKVYRTVKEIQGNTAVLVTAMTSRVNSDTHNGQCGAAVAALSGR